MILYFKPTTAKRYLFFLIFDLSLSIASLLGAYTLRFNFSIPTEFLSGFWNVFWILFLIKLFYMILFRNYQIIWRFFGFSEAKNLVYAHLLAYLTFSMLFLAFESFFNPFARSIIIIDFILSLLLLGLLRASKRLILEHENSGAIPTFIIGVNPKTASIIKNALSRDIPYFPVAIFPAVNEESTSLNSYISNVRVFGREELQKLSSRHAVQSAIITAELSQAELKLLYEELTAVGITDIKKVKLLGSRQERLEDLSIEDLLARHPKDLDTKRVHAFIHGKSILITGAGGSIGSEIALQCHRFGAKKLILLDSGEFNLYQIGERLPDATLRLISVTDTEKLDALFASTQIDIVIHAAAYKHVPLCEANIDTAIENNIRGTKNVIDLSIAHHVPKLVIISTDKAVRPTNVMGATKRISELYAQNVNADSTEIVSVRFGNVLGSSGSVIPKFKAQIEAGGPVTVTHPEMTRYFMLIPEACQLVLQAASIAKGGELFILDMGAPVKIVDLARQMIRLYGKEEEIEIEFCGLRPGEKLYEELLLGEHEKKTEFESIFVANKTDYDIATLKRDIDTLFTCNDTLAQLKKIVPEFEHRP